MATGNFSSQAVHLTSLDLEVSGVTASLNKVKQETEATAAEIRKIMQDAFNSSELSDTAKVTDEQSKSFSKLNDELSKTKSKFNETASSAKSAKQEIKDVGNSAKESSLTVSDFVNRLSDKAKWLAAYELIVLVEDAFSNLIGTIKNTEDAVVQLQRVLNEDIESSAISDELYRIADQYGQTFDNVQETAVLFAQTGQSWQEVIASTEATMLALNTAELEVTDATSGLIAVMAQFGIEATDLESVIDKINITADNFAVTSQSIVEALQRSGGTASAYNMTLEETVGIITALAEATGRSGSALGTALNSLITFSMKASSLEKFSDYLGLDVSEGYDVLEIWTMLSSKINDSGEQLAYMMAGSEEFAELFSEEMATAIGLTDEYNAAMMNSQDVYSAVGTYRQNYFIALLNNIQTAVEAINGMTDAEGYSLQENQKYMETLTAQYNQLVIAAQELAVQFGEAGFLDFLKFIVSLSTNVLSLTENFGGLYTILSAVTTLFVVAKIDKIIDRYTKLKTVVGTVGSSFKSAVTFISTFTKTLWTSKSATEALTVASAGLKLSLGGVIGIIGASVTAVIAISSAIENWKEEMKQARQEAIELGKTSTDEAKNIYSAYESFIKAQGAGGEQLDEATKSLLESLGYEADDISILVERYETLENAIASLIDQKYQLLKVNAQEAQQAAEQSARDIQSRSFSIFSNVDTDKKIYDILSDAEYYGIQTTQVSNPRTSFEKISLQTPKTIEEAEKSLESYKEVLDLLNKSLDSNEKESSDFYKGLVDQIDLLNTVVTEYDRASENLDLYGEEWSDFMDNVASSSQEAQEAIDGLSDSSSVSLESLQSQLDSLSESYDTISGKIDEFQSAYSTLNDVIDEYNETGIMSADMLQTLLSLEPEYINLLDISSNSITIKGDATNNLVAAQDVYLQQLAALRIEEYATQLQADALTAANQGLTLSEYEAANGASLMSGEVYDLIVDFLNGQMSADDFANSLLGVGNFASIAAENVNYFRNAISGYAETISGLLGSSMRSTSGIQRYYTPKISTPSSSSTKNAALEAEKEQLQDQIDLWEKKKEEVEEYYDAQIEALQEVQDSNDRINEQLDYYNDRQEVITNLEQAQARSGVEYRQKEMEYQQELIDLEKEWQDQLEDWDIEDQIDQLEMLKEKSVEEISAVIESLQEKVSELSKSTATSVASGVSSGLSYASSAVDLFAQNVSDLSEKQANEAKEQAVSTSDTTLETYKTMLINPFFSEVIEAVGSIQKESIKKSSETAKSMMNEYRKNLISPLQNELKNAMISEIGYSGGIFKSPSLPIKAQSKQFSSTNNVNMYANIGSASAANSTAKALSGLLKFPTNPSSFS